MRTNGHGRTQETVSGPVGEAQKLGRLLAVGEVAELLHVPASWVYERTRRRGKEQLPHLKLGKYLRFEEKAVREFLERLRRN